MKYALVLVLVVLFVMGLFSPLFFQNKILFDSDVASYNYPALSFYQTERDNHGFLSWNPYYLQGFPMALSPVGDHIDPLTRALALVVTDPFLLLHIRFIISLLLGLIFAYIFARLAGLSEAAAFIVSGCYFLGQTLTGVTAALVNSGSFFVLPALLSVALCLNKGRSVVLCAFLGSILLTFGWLAGFTQNVFYSVIFVLIFALYLSIKSSSVEGIFARFRVFWGITASVLLSVFIALPQLLDTVLFRSITTRVSGFGSLPDGIALGELAHFFLPDYLTIPYIAGGPSMGFYIGALPIFFVLFSVFNLSHVRYGRFFLYAYIGALIFVIKWLGFSTLVQQLPIFSSFHTLSRALFPGVFFLAYLAGSGFDILRQGNYSEPAQKRFLKIGTLLMFTVVLCAVLLQLFIGFYSFTNENILNLLTKIFIFVGKDPHHLLANPAYYTDLFRNLFANISASFSFLNWKFVFPLMFLPLGMGLIVLVLKGKISKNLFGKVAIVFIALNIFLVYAAQFDQYISLAEVKHPSFTANRIQNDRPSLLGSYLLSFLTGESLYRSLGSASSLTPDARYGFLRESLTSNTNIIYKVPRADGYEPFRSARQEYFWRNIIGNESLDVGNDLFDVALEKKKKLFLSQMPLLSSLNVSYIESGYKLEHSCFTELFVDHKEKLPINLHLYKNNCAVGRVWAPSQVEIVSEWTNNDFSRIIDSSQPLAVIECKNCKISNVGFSGGEIISNEIYENGHVSFVANGGNTGRWIVVAQSNLPGWKAYVDDIEVPIRSANYLLQSVFVGSGVHRVSLTYKGFSMKEYLNFFGIQPIAI